MYIFVSAEGILTSYRQFMHLLIMKKQILFFFLRQAFYCSRLLVKMLSHVVISPTVLEVGVANFQGFGAGAGVFGWSRSRGRHFVQ